MRAQRYKKTIPEQKFLISNEHVYSFIYECAMMYCAFVLLHIFFVLGACINSMSGFEKKLIIYL